MKIDDYVTNEEFYELLRGALIKVHGRDFSIQQIKEAYTIAQLTTAIFQDSLEKIYRMRYGCPKK